jgi:hypothetical protein
MAFAVVKKAHLPNERNFFCIWRENSLFSLMPPMCTSDNISEQQRNFSTTFFAHFFRHSSHTELYDDDDDGENLYNS